MSNHIKTSIFRIEVTSEVIRIYLCLDSLHCVFYLIIKNGNQERFVLKGSIPHKSGPLPLFNIASEETIIAHFEGNRHGGDIVIEVKKLPPLTEFFIQIEETLGNFEESLWYSITPKVENESKVVAVIPCYNAARYCEAVIRGALACSNHVIVVNDGSTDETGPILLKLDLEFKDTLSVVELPTNCGKGVALLKGFKYALSHLDFDSIITLDADAQHRPSDICYLAHAIEEGAEMAIGERLLKLMPPRSRFGNTFIAALLRLIYPGAPDDTQSGMRAFTRDFVKEIINKVPEGHYEMELECLLLALKQHRRIKSLRISTLYIDKNASSHFSVITDSIKIIWSLFKHAIKKVFS